MKTKDEKNKAFALRKEGKSYKEISKFLFINKSTISDWFKDVAWSQVIKHKLIEKSKETSRQRLIELNVLKRAKLAKHYLVAEAEATREFILLKKDKLFITGISLYWGEGDKVFKNGIVRISNIDENLLRIFNDFLQKICRIEIGKIRAGILLYPDLKAEECLEFWSKNVEIAKDRFFKSTVIQGKHKTRRLGNGVCIISVHNKYFKKKILTWLDLFVKEF